MKIEIYQGGWKEMEVDDGAFGRYRKKPIVVSAVEVAFPFRVLTDEGLMTGLPGDWLIRGVKGELYPCKPDIFEQTYEEVKE